MRKKFYRNIVFSKTPLKTHYRHADEFQIFPCNFANAPRFASCHDFPLIIEYWIDEDEKVEISEEFSIIRDTISRGTPSINKLNKLLRLLSSITNHRFFSYGETETKWGVPMPPEDGRLEGEELEKYNSQSSQLYLGIYTFDKMSENLKINDFSVRENENSKFSRHFLYYMTDPVDDRTKEITFPVSISQTLTKYFSLDNKTNKIVDSVTHLICNGIDIRPKMKSLAFLSFVSAIETLVNFEYKDKNDGITFDCPDCQAIKDSPLKCPKCERPVWGVKAKYKEFLKTYISNSEESVKKFNRIYNLRSDIVHNGMLLLGDNEMSWAKSDKADNQFITMLETMQLARLSLVNWLCLGPNNK